MKQRAVVLVSGGMDSCVVAAIAASEYDPLFLHICYGQRTEKKERECFEKIAEYFGVKDKLIVDISYLKKIGGSSLIDTNLSVPKPDIGSTRIPSTYVPFRNAHLLAIATSLAEAKGIENIFIGVVAVDGSNYPDCRPEFIRAFAQAINEGTKPSTQIKIIAPLINLRKAEIVKKGIELNAPFHLTWSCYKNTEIACGDCDSCVLRWRAFKEAGTKDPIPYERIPE